jgi:putative peptide zinc metalloprotease protein
MGAPLRSENWYRVAHLRPRLRVHARLHRQRFRGQLWYVLQDRQNGQFHRLSPLAHEIVCLMDGRRSLDDIHRLAAERRPDDPPAQDEMIRLLAQLHAADLLVGDLPPDMAELTQRGARRARRSLLQNIGNPLAIRLPLIDPQPFLDMTAPLARLIFSRWGFTVWLTAIVGALFLAGPRWSALTHNIGDRALSAQNVFLLALLYPAVKALHELGHGMATARWGGEVREMGVMLLVLMPVPYVDASAASAFPEKRRRIFVSLAGVMVEMFLAAVAMGVWALVEKGFVRAAAFDVMLIGGLSTLFVNGNPLLRFDGYYALSDYLEIPNLAARANAGFFHLVKRRLFGAVDLPAPETAPGEAPWLLFYAIASFLYRLSASLAIALFIASRFFFVGVVLALWSLAVSLVLPAAKGIRFLLHDPQLQRVRRRALLSSCALVAAAGAATLALPLPYATLAQGVVAVPERATLRARTEGDVVAVAPDGGGDVAAGAWIASLADPALESETRVLEAQAESCRLRLGAVATSDPVQANIHREQLRHLEAALESNRRRLADLVVVAPRDGRLILPRANDLPGRFLRKGEVIGYVVGADDPTVRVVVPEADIDLVRRRRARVDIRFADRVAGVVPAEVVREAPAATEELPSLALSTQGGGDIVLDPGKTDAPRALENQFLIELRVAAPSAPLLIGERVHVRFDHGREPVAGRLWRALRQLLLRQFDGPAEIHRATARRAQPVRAASVHRRPEFRLAPRRRRQSVAAAVRRLADQEHGQPGGSRRLRGAGGAGGRGAGGAVARRHRLYGRSARHGGAGSAQA